MKKLLLAAVLFLASVTGYSQNKKVAVVTLYAVKKIGVADFGNAAQAAVTKLSEDPRFNMEPLLKNFHDVFFNTYAKSLPFQLLPEGEVIENAEYKAYTPVGASTSGILKDTYNVPYPGYKVVLQLAGRANETALLKMFSQADGVMKIYIDFDLVKVGFGGMGVVKVNAHVNIDLFNKAGDKVFTIKQDGRSKNSSPLIGGVPVMSPDKILPMCQSALAELMVELQSDLPKITKKADAKL